MSIRALFLFAPVLGVLALPAASQVVELPPFTGSQSEGFETQVAAGMTGWQPCIVGGAFGQTVDVCSPLGDHLTVTQSWSLDCTASPLAGEYLAGVRAGSYVLLSFQEPVDRFGGHFAVNTSELGTVTAYFYGDTFQLLGERQLQLTSDCSWSWNGWESQGEPIRFIELVHSLHGGGRLLFDELTLDPSDGTIGQRYCDALPGSTGSPALLTASGSTSISASDLLITASPLPASAAAILFYGPTSIEAPFGPATRCVGAGQLGIQRLPAAQADSGGQLTIALDYASLAFLPISAGSTWYFQAWYADGGQPMGAGLSDALELVFVP